MPTWNSDQYLRFARERTQPAVDLAARIDVAAPRRVIDLGCGPGNSTAVLARRWPEAELTGLDHSPAMLATARRDHPAGRWIEGDLATWRAESPYDVVFSNAALQWVPDHPRVVPHLLAQLAPGGALAVQVPANFEAPPHRAMRELAAAAPWRARFAGGVREWFAQPPESYYDLLAPRSARIDLWITDYVHVLPGLDAIVEWYKGSGLRPYLDALPDDADRQRFLADYAAAIAPAYPPRGDGCVLFPFRRLFFVAYR